VAHLAKFRHAKTFLNVHRNKQPDFVHSDSVASAVLLDPRHFILMSRKLAGLRSLTQTHSAWIQACSVWREDNCMFFLSDFSSDPRLHLSSSASTVYSISSLFLLCAPRHLFHICSLEHVL
jgi:hypothetical protein